MKRKFANKIKTGKNEYYIKRIDKDYFKGYICLVKLKSIKEPWIVEDEDFIGCILDENYEWLEIYPDNKKYAITVIFDDRKNLIEWYFDMIKTRGIKNGIPYIDDLYLDLVIRNNGNQRILDEDELEDALKKSDITKEDFDMAYRTMKEIQEKYGNNLEQLNKLTYTLYNEIDR